MGEIYQLITSTGYRVTVMIIAYFVQAIVYYKLAQKANVENEWYAFVPILQEILFFHMIDKSGWYVLIGLIGIIPVVGQIIALIITIIFEVQFYKAFDTPTIWIVLSLLFTPITIIYKLYMAFSESVVYVETSKYQRMY